LDAHGTHHPFFHDINGVDDLGGVDVEVTILLVRNPFDSHRSYDLFVERMRGWGPKTLQEFVQLWEKTNLHWAAGPGAAQWIETEKAEEASVVGRLLVVRYEHLVADPVQSLSALVTAGLTTPHQLQAALHAVAPAFRASPQCHLTDSASNASAENSQEKLRASVHEAHEEPSHQDGGAESEGGTMRATRNALDGYSQEKVEAVFKRNKHAFQAFGYSCVPPGRTCAHGGGADRLEL
jgi:hypothetical protein